jgi:hypothetical protein
MPPMSPPPGIGGAKSFFGTSATIASVVIRSPATDAAPCNAARRTPSCRTRRFARRSRSRSILLKGFADYHRAILARIKGDLARGQESALRTIRPRGSDPLEHFAGAQEARRCRPDAFLDGLPCCSSHLRPAHDQIPSPRKSKVGEVTMDNELVNARRRGGFPSRRLHRGQERHPADRCVIQSNLRETTTRVLASLTPCEERIGR